MARIAIISDIHGNLPGLERVLEDIDARACDRIVCLGDLVDGGEHENEVVDEIRRRKIPTVRGNHDEGGGWRTTPERRAFLAGLPQYLAEGEVLYAHISPRPANKRKIADKFEASNAFDEWKTRRLAFVGHAHVPRIFGEESPRPFEALEHPVRHNRAFKLRAGERYIVCVGAVGYPRDGIRKLRYAIFDDELDLVEARAIDGPLLDLGW
jgi:predicted phosphodiesterase